MVVYKTPDFHATLVLIVILRNADINFVQLDKVTFPKTWKNQRKSVGNHDIGKNSYTIKYIIKIGGDQQVGTLQCKLS